MGILSGFAEGDKLHDDILGSHEWEFCSILVFE